MRKVRTLLFLFLLIFVFACDESTTEYEITQYNKKVLFYGFDIGAPENSSIYTVNIDGTNLEKISGDENDRYPSWFSYPKTVIFYRANNFEIRTADTGNPGGQNIIFESPFNMLFPRYYDSKGIMLFVYEENAVNKIAYYDFNDNEIKYFSLINFNAENPVLATKTNFVYFRGTFPEGESKILRISLDGTNLQIVLDNSLHKILTFDISPDSELLVAARYDENESYITVYDLNTLKILHNINTTHSGGALYVTFTSDGKRILYTNGIPNDYSQPRNIFITDLNGDNLRQITFAEDKIYARPLNW